MVHPNFYPVTFKARRYRLTIRVSIVAGYRTPDRTEPRRTQSRGSVPLGFGPPTFVQTKSGVESSAKFNLTCLLGLNPKGEEAQRRPNPKGDLRICSRYQLRIHPGIQSNANLLSECSGLGPLRGSVLCQLVSASTQIRLGVGSPPGFSPLQIVFGNNKEYSSGLSPLPIGFGSNGEYSSGLGPMHLGVGYSSGFSPLQISFSIIRDYGSGLGPMHLGVGSSSGFSTLQISFS